MERWSIDKINRWHEKTPRMIGYNFVPTYAVNDVEFWMDDTFDIEKIRNELHIGAEIGYNSVRVFLPYIVWKHEGKIFERNFDAFLDAAKSELLSVVPVLFDDCAFDNASDPVYGAQPSPCTDLRNLGRWVPSPGFAVQDDRDSLEACRDYVHAIIGLHRNDDRILLWDLYNEPGNTNRYSKSIPLLSKAFIWARECEPSQPLTVGPWLDIPQLDEVAEICISESDIISFHSYRTRDALLKQLELYAQYDRPVIVTEWFNRCSGSLPEDILPVFYEKNIRCWQWGLIGGRGHDNYSPLKNSDGSMLWQHDLLDSEGNVYDAEQLKFIRSYTEKL